MRKITLRHFVRWLLRRLKPTVTKDRVVKLTDKGAADKTAPLKIYRAEATIDKSTFKQLSRRPCSLPKIRSLERHSVKTVRSPLENAAEGGLSEIALIENRVGNLAVPYS